MNQSKTLGQRIQEGRRAAGLSQEALGEQLHVSRQAVSKWEADAAIPELENLIAMSRMFGLSVGQLLGVETPQEDGEAPQGSPEELTETQLHMVQEIVDRYLAAQPERKKSPWGKWDVRILFALCGVMLALLGGLSHRVSRLDNRYTGLQQSIGSISSSVNGQIQSITDQMSNILDEKNNILANSTVFVTDFDLRAQTVTLRVTAAPKEWTDTTTAVFIALLSDGRQFTAEAQGQNGAYTAEGFVVPMDQAIQLSVALTDAGSSRTGAMDTLYDCLSGCFQLTVEGSWSASYRSNSRRQVALSALDLRIEAEMDPPYDLALAPTAVDLCLYRNRETEPEQVLPVPQAVELFQEAGYVQMCNLTGYQTAFELEDGDAMVIAARVADNHGGITYTVLDSYICSHGSISNGMYASSSDWKPGAPLS